MRCYWPIVCVACPLILGFASLAEAQNSGVRTRTAATDVGNDAIIGIHGQLNLDCSSAGKPEVRVNNPPLHGTVYITSGPYDTRQARPNTAVAKCRGRIGSSMPGVHVMYKPNPGFTGSDAVGYTVISHHKRSDEHRVTVTVHTRLVAAASAPDAKIERAAPPAPVAAMPAEALAKQQAVANRGDAPAPVPSLDSSRRVALVIGNSAYRAVPQLPNPQRDAEAVAAALRGAGFQSVKFENDLTRNNLIEALRSFARQAETADWAVVYFAGHGIEVGGVNYLVPIDARLESDRDVQFDAVALDQVLGAVDGAKRLRVVILDACRENPFVPRMRKTVASRSIGRGLASVEPSSGTLVIYAARDGQIAMDGEGANSPFVAALLKNLETPGVEIGLLFRRVRDDVLNMTGRRQEPFTYGSLPSESFYFRAPVAAK